ncbi:L-threonine 3-dehydrogenase-like [Anneissia japonica]|uniref:L-threonine 3-dehydrogenase-like n=1 Tax=Anneissia japonica TaxID=1529436 RepID=UPI001425BB1C|nr:L-threonine 3-dehydrogenase-like [Anneissia japonica]
MASVSAQRVVFFGADRTPRFMTENTHINLGNLGPEEILIKIKLTTICRYDLQILQGRSKAKTPSVLGHEAVGEVVKVGSSLDDEAIKPGDRVSFSLYDSCFKCKFCQSGFHQKCISGFMYGQGTLSSHQGFSGCFASHVIVKRGTKLVKLPDNVSDKMAAPLNCAIATMAHATSMLPTEDAKNKTVLIQGAGLFGIYGCAMLHQAGYSKVYCTDYIAERLKLVNCFGGIPLDLRVKGNYPDDDSIDIVIEVCGNPAVIPEGVRVLKPGGVYMFVGLVNHNTSLNITVGQLIDKCLTVTGVDSYSPEHLEAGVDFIAKYSNKYPFENLVGPIFKLSNFDKAVKEAGNQRFLRVALEADC